MLQLFVCPNTDIKKLQFGTDGSLVKLITNNVSSPWHVLLFCQKIFEIIFQSHDDILGDMESINLGEIFNNHILWMSMNYNAVYIF